MKYSKLTLPIILIILIVFFSLARIIKGNYYKLSVEEAFNMAKNEKLFIRTTEINNVINPIVVSISKNDTNVALNLLETNTINIELSDLNNKEVYRRISNKKNSIVIFSDDLAISTQAWVFLTRKGINGIRILEKED